MSKQKYIYIDHRIQKVIFVVDAESITSADKQYTHASGEDPAKQSHVGCCIFDLDFPWKTKMEGIDCEAW